MPISPARFLAALSGPQTAVETASLQSTIGSVALDWDARGEPLPRLTALERIAVPGLIFLLSGVIIFASHSAGLISTVWPINAIMVAVLLCRTPTPLDYAYVVVGGTAASALASWCFGTDALVALAIMAGNALEVAIALILLAACRIRASNLTSFRGILTFILLAGGISPLLPSLVSIRAFGVVHTLPLAVLWRSWYAGHALGMIIVVPFLVSVMSREWIDLRIEDRVAEAFAIFAVFITISVCVDYFRPVIFGIAPAILLTTVRFGIIGATASTFLVAIIASVFVVLGIGHPLFLTQPLLSQRIFALQAFLGITSFWSLPTAAVLAERGRLLRDLSHANAQLAADSERKSHLVSGLRRHLSMAEENERLRLSHELHDQAGQSVIAAILELNEIDALSSGPAHQRLTLLRKKMEAMGKTLHRIAWELRPPSIHEVGLRKALASYIADWSEQCGIEADFHCDDPKIDDVPDEIGTAVYRVVQEGLTNVVKHAERPSAVSVVIRRPDATLQIIVEDNGCGFDLTTLTAPIGKRRGLGLAGMRERLALIGGTLDVESAAGVGTTLFARIALDAEQPGT